MVVGFNHNVRYREQLFHVQTEDSGLKKPHIITLLYFGGTIIASKKTSYADITRVDNLEAVVEDLMKEQHKEMLRRLKSGEFDRNIKALLEVKSLTDAEGSNRSSSLPASKSSAEKSSGETITNEHEKRDAGEGKSREAPDGNSLDEVILSYLVDDEKKK